MDAQDDGTALALAAPELAHHHHVDLAPLGTAAAHLVVTPTSEKALDAALVGGLAQIETRCRIFEHPADDGKRFAMLRAHLALKGYCLNSTAAIDGPVCFYVTHSGVVVELRDLAAAARFLDKVGGAHA